MYHSAWYKKHVVLRCVCKIAKSDLLLSYPSLRPAVCIEQLGSHWMDSHEIWCSRIFWKSVEKFWFHYNLRRI